MFQLLLILACSDPVQRALPPQAPEWVGAKLPPQAPPRMAPCGMGHMCPCGCYEGGLCVCSFPHKSYTEWRGAVAKKRRVAKVGGGVSCLCEPCGCTQRVVCPCDSPLLVSTPRPVSLAPAVSRPFMPSFTSFAGASCSGGG